VLGAALGWTAGVPQFDFLPSRLFPRLGFPVLQQAGDIVQDSRPDFDRDLVEYSVIEEFPANAIIPGYEDAFRTLVLVPDPDQGYPMRRWESWESRSQAWKPAATLGKAPTRYVASWVTRKRDVRTLLILRYDPTSADPDWQRRLHVHVSHQKLFSLWDLLPWRRTATSP